MVGIVKVGIVGSRSRDSIEDFNLVEKAFIEIYKNLKDSYIHIISGGNKKAKGKIDSKGADRFAKILAELYDCDYTEFIPHYDLFPSDSARWDAPKSRNTKIAEESEILIACVSSDRSGGTEDTVKKFQEFHPDGKLILV